MSLALRLTDEVGEFLRAAALWFLLNPAFAPANSVVSALPFPIEWQFWHGAVLSVVGVSVVRYYDPSWELLRGFVVGVATTATFTPLYVFSELGRVVADGGSWRAFGGVFAFWLAGLAVGVALAHPRTWRWVRESFEVG